MLNIERWDGNALSGRYGHFCYLMMAILLLAGCSGAATSMTAGTTVGSSYLYGSYGYADPRWYFYDDDWIYYYPGCCVEKDELHDRLKEWWDAQDPERQQAIKEHISGWNEQRFSTNIPALQQQFDRQWQSMTVEQQKKARQKWQTTLPARNYNVRPTMGNTLYPQERREMIRPTSRPTGLSRPFHRQIPRARLR